MLAINSVHLKCWLFVLGFYRVNYDPENWNLLLIQLQKDPNKIPVSNRAQILNDAFALANLNLLNYSRALNLTKYLSLKENHSVPWTAAVQSLEGIKIVLQNSDHYRDFQVEERLFCGNSVSHYSLSGFCYRTSKKQVSRFGDG